MRRLPRVAVAMILCACALPATALAAAGDPLRSQQWDLDMIHADQAHVVTDGARAVVGVVDTGIDASHPDLQGRILPGYDFVSGDSTPQDGNGHGTHVSGIIAADAGNGIGIDSVAPAAKILPVRVLDDSGAGSDADVAQGIDWATNHGADVINLSLGPTLATPALGAPATSAAVNRAVQHGVIVVAAAGNDALPFCENNSDQGKVLCVGAVDKRGNRSFYSNFGNGVSLVAPGGSGLGGSEDILSTWNNGGYQVLAGTSQATPHVSGVAALLVSLGVRGQGAVQRILSTATDLGPPGHDALYGAGVVNAQAAVSGLGGGGSGSGNRNARPHIAIARRQHIAAVLKHGIIVRCRSPRRARCSARASYRRHLLAHGSRRLASGHTVRVHVRATRRGRRVLRRALHHHRTLRTTVTVRLSGVTVRRRILLVP